MVGSRLALLAFLTPLVAVSGEPGITDRCTFRGHRLYGKIQEVKAFPDVKVQVVHSSADLRVQLVENVPDSCGKWKMVEHFAETKVQFVTRLPDVRIRYVESFPGKP